METTALDQLTGLYVKTYENHIQGRSEDKKLSQRVKDLESSLQLSDSNLINLQENHAANLLSKVPPTKTILAEVEIPTAAQPYFMNVFGKAYSIARNGERLGFTTLKPEQNINGDQQQQLTKQRLKMGWGKVVSDCHRLYQKNRTSSPGSIGVGDDVNNNNNRIGASEVPPSLRSSQNEGKKSSVWDKVDDILSFHGYNSTFGDDFIQKSESQNQESTSTKVQYPLPPKLPQINGVVSKKLEEMLKENRDLQKSGKDVKMNPAAIEILQGMVAMGKRNIEEYNKNMKAIWDLLIICYKADPEKMKKYARCCEFTGSGIMNTDITEMLAGAGGYAALEQYFNMNDQANSVLGQIMADAFVAEKKLEEDSVRNEEEEEKMHEQQHHPHHHSHTNVHLHQHEEHAGATRFVKVASNYKLYGQLLFDSINSNESRNALKVEFLKRFRRGLESEETLRKTLGIDDDRMKDYAKRNEIDLSKIGNLERENMEDNLCEETIENLRRNCRKVVNWNLRFLRKNGKISEQQILWFKSLLAYFSKRYQVLLEKRRQFKKSGFQKQRSYFMTRTGSGDRSNKNFGARTVNQGEGEGEETGLGGESASAGVQGGDDDDGNDEDSDDDAKIDDTIDEDWEDFKVDENYEFDYESLLEGFDEDEFLSTLYGKIPTEQEAEQKTYEISPIERKFRELVSRKMTFLQTVLAWAIFGLVFLQTVMGMEQSQQVLFSAQKGMTSALGMPNPGIKPYRERIASVDELSNAIRELEKENVLTGLPPFEPLVNGVPTLNVTQVQHSLDRLIEVQTNNTENDLRPAAQQMIEAFETTYSMSKKTVETDQAFSKLLIKSSKIVENRLSVFNEGVEKNENAEALKETNVVQNTFIALQLQDFLEIENAMRPALVTEEASVKPTAGGNANEVVIRQGTKALYQKIREDFERDAIDFEQATNIDIYTGSMKRVVRENLMTALNQTLDQWNSNARNEDFVSQFVGSIKLSMNSIKKGISAMDSNVAKLFESMVDLTNMRALFESAVNSTQGNSAEALKNLEALMLRVIESIHKYEVAYIGSYRAQNVADILRSYVYPLNPEDVNNLTYPGLAAWMKIAGGYQALWKLQDTVFYGYASGTSWLSSPITPFVRVYHYFTAWGNSENYVARFMWTIIGGACFQNLSRTTVGIVEVMKAIFSGSALEPEFKYVLQSLFLGCQTYLSFRAYFSLVRTLTYLSDRGTIFFNNPQLVQTSNERKRSLRRAVDNPQKNLSPLLSNIYQKMYILCTWTSVSSDKMEKWFGRFILREGLVDSKETAQNILQFSGFAVVVPWIHFQLTCLWFIRAYFTKTVNASVVATLFLNNFPTIYDYLHTGFDAVYDWASSKVGAAGFGIAIRDIVARVPSLQNVGTRLIPVGRFLTGYYYERTLYGLSIMPQMATLALYSLYNRDSSELQGVRSRSYNNASSTLFWTNVFGRSVNVIWQMQLMKWSVVAITETGEFQRHSQIVAKKMKEIAGKSFVGADVVNFGNKFNELTQHEISSNDLELQKLLFEIIDHYKPESFRNYYDYVETLDPRKEPLVGLTRFLEHCNSLPDLRRAVDEISKAVTLSEITDEIRTRVSETRNEIVEAIFAPNVLS